MQRWMRTVHIFPRTPGLFKAAWEAWPQAKNKQGALSVQGKKSSHLTVGDQLRLWRRGAWDGSWKMRWICVGRNWQKNLQVDVASKSGRRNRLLRAALKSQESSFREDKRRLGVSLAGGVSWCQLRQTQRSLSLLQLVLVVTEHFGTGKAPMGATLRGPQMEQRNWMWKTH